MSPICRVLSMSMLLAAGLVPHGHAATLLSSEDADRIVSLRNVTTDKDGAVSGEVVNHSKQMLRDVRLQILYSWRWNNEFRPGKDDPGMAAYPTIDQEIRPGGSARFSHAPSTPLPARADGYFETSVKVVGFTEVFR